MPASKIMRKIEVYNIFVILILFLLLWGFKTKLNISICFDEINLEN